jgi:phospholipid transport system substrate-binding protein
MRRRGFSAGGIVFAGLCLERRDASADIRTAERASEFIQKIGNEIVSIINGTQTAGEKKQSLARILDNAVDVDAIARFCLGRFWRRATPDQKRRYLSAFRQILLTNITARLGEYRGVSVSVMQGHQQDGATIVSTVISRPNNPPAALDWVVEQGGAMPQIVDLVAEGVSMRLTQRQDYASFLSRNGYNIDALIDGIERQATGNQR